MMDEIKSAEMLAFGISMGLHREDILRMRDLFSRRQSLSLFLREKLDSNAITFGQAKHMLISAFGLSVGDIQPIHLWKDSKISSEEFDECLQDAISNVK